MTARTRWLGLCGIAFASGALCQRPGLEPGKTVERSIAPGEVQNYPLDLPGGQIVRMFFRQVLPFEVTVKLFAPDGRTLTERTSRQNLIFSALGTDAGHYVLEVSAPKSSTAGAGQYTVSHIETRGVKPEDGALLKADADYSQFRRRAAASSEEAATKLDAAVSLYAQAKEPDYEGWSLLLAGQYKVRLSDYQQAADRYARAAGAFETARNNEGRANALDFLGDISAVLRDYPKAIEASSEALKLSRANNLQSIEAGSLSVLGRSYSQLGEKQRALEFFQQAIVLARRVSDRTREAEALSAAASLNNSLGNHDKALAFYQEALAIQRSKGAPLDEAAALSNIGSSYASLGQPAKAIEYFQEAIVLFRKTGGGRPALATTLSDCGQAYLAMNQPPKAVPLLEEALDIARETANRWSEAYTLMNLGRSRHAMNDLSGAAGMLTGALAIQREIGDSQAEAVTRFEIARLERTRGNLEAAHEQASKAIGLVESLRNQVAVPDLRSSLVASVRDYYQLDVDVLMQLYGQSGSLARLEEARQAAERGRARNLLDVLAAAGIGPATAPDPGLAAREQKLRRDLDALSAKRNSLLHTKAFASAGAGLDRQIDDTWTEYQSVRSKLIAADPQAVSAANPATLDWDAVRRETLDSNTVLLEYSLGEPRSYAWAISHDEIHGFELTGRVQIEDAARAFWEAVKGGLDAGSVERAAARLSKMVLAPVGSLLANKRLLIVADGALQYVPFAALGDPARPSGGYRPLILAHEVIDEPSTATLALLRRGATERRPAQHTLAVFADPVFEATDPRVSKSSPSAVAGDAAPAFLTRAAELGLARLPATRQEGRSIASLLPVSERWLALDFDASRTAATSPRLSDYRILHFATHGVVESSHPELSALAFSLYDAQGKPQDGFLRLYEIYSLRVQADLVVLSACDTALGKDVRGEGLVGLARGFMHAGAPRVVASLWKVDDQATSELMRLFYTAMLGPRKQPAAAALRAAQIAVAKQERWRSPYYWAAFVLQGEWR